MQMSYWVVGYPDHKANSTLSIVETFQNPAYVWLGTNALKNFILRNKSFVYIDYLDLLGVCIYLEPVLLPFNIVLYTEFLFQKHLYGFKSPLLNSLQTFSIAAGLLLQ